MALLQQSSLTLPALRSRKSSTTAFSRIVRTNVAAPLSNVAGGGASVQGAPVRRTDERGFVLNEVGWCQNMCEMRINE